MRGGHTHIQSRALVRSHLKCWLDIPARVCLLLFLGVILTGFASFSFAQDDVHPSEQEFKTREEFGRYREAAWAHFNKRCKEDAKETIYRVVEDVQAAARGERP